MSSDLEPLLTKREVCDWLKVSPWQVTRFCHRTVNPLPHMRVGRRDFRFERAKVDAWWKAEQRGEPVRVQPGRAEDWKQARQRGYLPA